MTLAAVGRPAAVRTEGLTKRYGDVVALDDLGLTVPHGVVFGLLGPNGAGKTTAIRLLAGLARPTAGSAWVGGAEVGGPGAGAPAVRVGYLDQQPRFYGWMRGRELVAFVGRLHGLQGADLAARVDDAMERVGLADAANRRIGGYSGGMRQRLGIAQALVHRPAVMFLDEPASALDPEGRRDVLELIHELRGDATIVFSTHVLADVERIADRVAILDRGRLLVEGPLSELLASYAAPIFDLEPEPDQAAAVETMLGGLRRAAWASDVAIERESIRITVSDAGAASVGILAEAVAARVRVARFERRRPTLEDVFLRLTGRRREAP